MSSRLRARPVTRSPKTNAAGIGSRRHLGQEPVGVRAEALIGEERIEGGHQLPSLRVREAADQIDIPVHADGLAHPGRDPQHLPAGSLEAVRLNHHDHVAHLSDRRHL